MPFISLSGQYTVSKRDEYLGLKPYGNSFGQISNQINFFFQKQPSFWVLSS
jgi:hypothetical protein